MQKVPRRKTQPKGRSRKAEKLTTKFDLLRAVEMDGKIYRVQHYAGEIVKEAVAFYDARCESSRHQLTRPKKGTKQMAMWLRAGAAFIAIVDAKRERLDAAIRDFKVAIR